jgi:hypothetical protein
MRTKTPIRLVVSGPAGILHASTAMEVISHSIRRVREAPGGKDSISTLWGSEDAEESFRPTRR